ncbi:MAG: DUF1003 domain-containing protein [Chlamydiota bacterium]|nr:DUF1003 domain-containing protein [Chlamydiota bacterium]
MKKKTSKQCEVCRKEFGNRDLYPLTLIRSNVFALAEQKYPGISRQGFVCFPDLHKISAIHFEEILKREKGALSELEIEVVQSLKQQDLLSGNVNKEFEEKLTLGDRLADKIATFGGSWTFILLFGFILICWMCINSFQYLNEPFDPFPYILLNLVLSSLAAFQAPIIMMSQNRQASKDRLTQEGDYQVNLKSELQVRQLNTRLELFMKHHWQKMHEIARTQEEIITSLENSIKNK